MNSLPVIEQVIIVAAMIILMLGLTFSMVPPSDQDAAPMLDPIDKLAAVNRGLEALERIRAMEARLEAAKTRAEIARLLSELAEAKSAIAVLKEAHDRKHTEAKR